MIEIGKSGRKEERITVRAESFSGICDDVPFEEIRNADVCGKKLRVCKEAVAPPFTLPQTVFGILEVNGKMLVAANEEGHISFYAVTGTQAEHHYSTAATFPNGMPMRDLCTVPVYTDDTSPHIPDRYNADGKLMLFSGRKLLFLSENGTPYMMLDMPEEVPDLDFGVFHDGRLYGAKGNACYVSGTGGCFHWETDPDGETPDPHNAWTGKLTAHAEEQQPATAMAVYKGEVYIFKRGAIQKVAGSENPFSVKTVYGIGTTDYRSVREIGGKLYFISEEGPVSFDGEKVKHLPALPEGVVFNGAAGTVGGRYAFYGRCDGRHTVFIHDARTDSYGVKEMCEEVIAFAGTEGCAYLLTRDADGIRQSVKMLDGRTSAEAEYRFPLCSGHFRSCGGTFAAVRCRSKGAATLTASLITVTENGAEQSCSLGSLTTEGGEIVLRARRKLPKASSLFLKINTAGDVTLCGYECAMRLKN